jgi:hypothetical protein
VSTRQFGPEQATDQLATAPSADITGGDTSPLTLQAFWKRAISRMKRRC